MPNIIVFDTETTGLPKTKVINPETLHLWPNIVQFSYIIYDTDRCNMIKISDDIVQLPSDIEMSEESIKIHKITNEMAHDSKHKTIDILDTFFEDITDYNVDTIVGHNVSFDVNMIKIEILRIIKNNEMTSKSKYKKMLYEISYTNKLFCTMHKTIDLCQIPARRRDGTIYYKYPKLVELYQKLFNESPENLHNALTDILITLRCYFMIVYKTDLNEKDKDTKQLILERTNGD